MIDDYIGQLRAALARRFTTNGRAVDEARAHLRDAAEAAIARGVPAADAEALAVARFGPVDVVAAHMVADQMRVTHRIPLAAALLVGLAIAWVNARPTWDDTGITAGVLALSTMGLTLWGPQHPWRWALATGIWIPLQAIAHGPALAALWSGLALVAALTGASVGRLTRRLLAAG